MADPAEAAAHLAEARRLEKSGRAEDAMRAFLRAGAPDEVLRLAKASGRLEAGARALAEAGRFLESAQCHLKAGDPKAALDRLLRVGAREPRYREAAREAVRLTVLLDALSVRFEQFVGPYISAGPEEEDLPTFYALGEFYDRQEMPENAEEVFTRLSERAPHYRDTQARLGAVREGAPVLDASAATVLGEDERFRRTVPRHERRTPPSQPALPESDSGEAGGTRRIPTPPGGVTKVPTPQPVAAAPPPPVAGPGFGAGTVVADRYRVEEEIGHGGMATVYRAHDMELAEDVALKVFRPGPQDREGIARFRQELKVSRRLVHPNITRLYDIGLHHGQRYISMELLVGNCLDEITGAQWALDRVLNCLSQVCEGLAAAHAQGVIHRDIKPGNIFLTLPGAVKIMDFGIARERTAHGVTQAGMVVGTPDYLSPEQIRGEPALETSDLYALGVVAYELVAGQKPFAHEELVPLLQMHLLTPPVPPTRHRPDLPAAFEAVILRLMQKNAVDRFQTARAVSDALAALRG